MVDIAVSTVDEAHASEASAGGQLRVSVALLQSSLSWPAMPVLAWDDVVVAARANLGSSLFALLFPCSPSPL